MNEERRLKRLGVVDGESKFELKRHGSRGNKYGRSRGVLCYRAHCRKMRPIRSHFACWRHNAKRRLSTQIFSSLLYSLNTNASCSDLIGCNTRSNFIENQSKRSTTVCVHWSTNASVPFHFKLAAIEATQWTFQFKHVRTTQIHFTYLIIS